MQANVEDTERLCYHITLIDVNGKGYFTNKKETGKISSGKI